MRSHILLFAFSSLSSLFLLTGCPITVTVDSGPDGATDSGVSPTPEPGAETGDLDGPCYGDNTCNGTLRCIDDTCVDAADGSLGGPCYANETCDGDLVCNNDTCIVDVIAVGDEGAPCFANDTCSGALFCIDDICTDAPAPGTEGGACLTDGAPCFASLECADDICRTPLPPTIVSFTASPTFVIAGETSTLEWSTTNTSSCTLTDHDDVELNGSVSVTPIVTKVFTLSCTNGDLVAEAQATINVSSPVEILSFAANAEGDIALTIDSGDLVTLIWSTRFATRCTITPDGSVVAPAATQEVSPEDSTTYVLDCEGEGGPVSAEVVIAVNQPVTIQSFTANNDVGPLTLDIGETIDLAWDVTDSESCSLAVTGDGVDTDDVVQASDTRSETATADRTYVLTCEGLGGPVTSTIFVDVRPQVAILAFTTATPSITTGTSATIVYETENADACSFTNSLDADVVDINDDGGIVVVTPLASTTYTLTCEGSGGPVVANVAIDALDPAIISSFVVAGNPSVVPYLETVQFNWSVTGASAGCSITGPSVNLTAGTLGIGAVSAQIYIAGDPGTIAVYRLRCVGVGGADSREISIPVAQEFIAGDVIVCDAIGCAATHTLAQLQLTTRIDGSLTISTNSTLGGSGPFVLPKLAYVGGTFNAIVQDTSVLSLPGLRYLESDANIIFTNSINEGGPEASGTVELDSLFSIIGDLDINAQLASSGELYVPVLETVDGSLTIDTTLCGIDYSFPFLQTTGNLTLNPFSGPPSPQAAFPIAFEVGGNLLVTFTNYSPGDVQAWTSTLGIDGTLSVPQGTVGSCP